MNLSHQQRSAPTVVPAPVILNHQQQMYQHSVPLRCRIVSNRAVEDEFSDGDICGVWFMWVILTNHFSKPNCWFSNQSFGEGMKSWDEISEAVNVTYEQTKQVDETAKIVGVSRWEVLEALGFSENGHSFLTMEMTEFWNV